MGLYKKNYEVKDLGITLPEAFAIVRKIDRKGNTGVAELWVHVSRENAKTLLPLERKTVPFTCADGDNPYEAAYNAAVERKEREYYTTEVEEVKEIVDGEEVIRRKPIRKKHTEIDVYFDGWERD